MLFRIIKKQNVAIFIGDLFPGIDIKFHTKETTGWHIEYSFFGQIIDQSGYFRVMAKQHHFAYSFIRIPNEGQQIETAPVVNNIGRSNFFTG